MKATILLLLFIQSNAEMKSPTFHELNDNPGLLPLKLGNAQNKIDQWSFIQIFDITDIVNEFNILRDRLHQLKSTIDNKTQGSNYQVEFYNSYYLTELLEKKIITQIYQINPSIRRKQKRGLIDGLGSIIRSITGNLDQNDAEKYDRAIEILSSNQNKMKTLISDQITLLQRSIDNFRNNTQTLMHNQELLNSRLEIIEKLIQTQEVKNLEMNQLLIIQLTISQITTAFQAIYDILEKIEIAITFSKLNIFHNSMAEPNEILKEVEKIPKYLTTSKLPFEPKIENILLFEKIIDIKAYSKHNKIIFIIEIPIVEMENYNYYHLYSLPTPKNNSFKTIIPKSKYLILNEENYVLFDTSCNEIINEEFLCQLNNPEVITEEAPCEIQMLKYSKKLTNCNPVPVMINRTKIQKIEENKWIIITPSQKVAKQTCKNSRESIPLHGTFILELTFQCEVKIDNTVMRTFQNPTIEFKPFKFPNLNFENNYSYLNPQFQNINPIKLEAINLDEMKHIQETLEIKKEEIKKIQDVPIDQKSIDIWTIILYVIFFIAILYAAYRFYPIRCLAIPDAPKEGEAEGTSRNSEINPGISL
ncbi:uncharacterized protein isoform X1 [Leptinotarsa decemlineata]|uniref:uncharacterized protein isoform X1 n=1 Tax=Leptinotarsa decemlineata TaxID=7539 RepID=UPI003D305146